MNLFLLAGDEPSAPPPPPIWFQLWAYVTTPTGAIIVGLIVATAAALWWAAETTYDRYALAVDTAEVAGPTAYAAERHRRKGARRK